MPATHTTHPNTALIIVGHGSTLNPDSSTPTHRHADEIRRRGIFDEVFCAFWKEEPSMREVFYMVKSERVFIVPNFISEGYFTRQILPRELRLDGAVTERDGKTLFYCDPVGIHPSMTRLLLQRADEVAPGVPRGETSLIIVGHGTSLNENSRKAIEEQVRLIREGGYGFAEVLDAYMEEAPLIAKWDELCTAPNAVVVPFFIADGLHSYQDIPVLLGIEAEPTAAASQHDVFRRNPHSMRGRNLYYSSAIGTASLMVEVILDQVNEFGISNAEVGIGKTKQLNSEFRIPNSEFLTGQVQATPQPDGVWLLHHRADLPDNAKLVEHYGVEAARGIALQDDAGNFRALKTAPNLQRGWLLRVEGEAELRLALDCLYPGALGLFEHWKADTLKPVPLRETLGRQTGMYRHANTITDEQAQKMVACECDAGTKCLRRITWPLAPGEPLTALTREKLPQTESTPASEIPLLCVEGCTHLVNAARELARRNYDSGKQTGS
jgi:sirohydrochlorin cobaltochelatase